MSPRTILVAVDDSPESVSTMQYVLDDIISKNDKIVVMHVYPSVQVMYPGAGSESDISIPPDVFESLRESAQKEGNRIVQKYIQMAKDKNIPCEGIVTEGDARDFLVSETENLKPDLLVVGSRGLGPIKRMVMGSVSSHCLNHASCPILVVKDDVTKDKKGEGEEKDKRVVMIALDGSQQATKTFRYAINSFCCPDRDRLVLMKAQTIPAWAAYAEFTPDGLDDRLEKEALLQNQNYLENFKKEANEKKFECSTDIVKGDPREAISWSADRHKVKILILGNSGKGAFSRLFLGSVSSYCCHHMSFPVLVFKTPKKDDSPPATSA